MPKACPYIKGIRLKNMFIYMILLHAIWFQRAGVVSWDILPAVLSERHNDVSIPGWRRRGTVAGASCCKGSGKKAVPGCLEGLRGDR